MIEHGLRWRIGRAVYFCARDMLEAEDIDRTPRMVDRIACRRARGAILRMRGFDKHEVVEILGVTKRTGDADWIWFTEAMDSGAIDGMRREQLPRVPRPADRIMPPRW